MRTDSAMHDNVEIEWKDRAGGFVDDLFLVLPRLLKKFKPARSIDRHTFEAEMDFYFKNGFVEKPDTFFVLPEEIPRYEIISESAYKDGRFHLVSFKSGYEVRNPYLKEEYNLHVENNTGYLARWTHGDTGRKTVLCIHGFMLGDPKQAHRMFSIKKLYDKGLDVALFVLPFHWRRSRGVQMLRGMNFLSPDHPARTLECMGQAMHDLRLAENILKELNTGEYGIIGASLGGYVAALYSCLSCNHKFAAMMVPTVSFEYQFNRNDVKLPFAVDEEIKRKREALVNMHSPLNFKPLLSGEDFLIIASKGDKLAPFNDVLSICEKWGRPGHCFLSGGHWLIFNNRQRGRAWYGFLADKGVI